MSYAVIYASNSGNTKKVAEAIAQALPKEELLYFGEADDPAKAADVIFTGFWTDKGTCPQEIMDFLSDVHGKQIALFGTCGFGGSEEYFNSILQRVSAFIEDDCTYLDGFMCQGKMPGGIRRRYENMLETSVNKEKVQQMIDNFDMALKHPDDHDLAQARVFAEVIVTSCR